MFLAGCSNKSRSHPVFDLFKRLNCSGWHRRTLPCLAADQHCSMSNGRRFVELDILPPKGSGGSGIVFTYTAGQAPDPGSDNPRGPRPVFIYAITPGSPADVAESHKRERLRPGDKVLAAQGRLIVPLDGSPSLPISTINELETATFRAGRPFRLKVARNARAGAASDAGSSTGTTATPAPPEASVVAASLASSSSSIIGGRQPFDFGYVVADVLSGVELGDTAAALDPLRRAHIRALTQQLPPEILQGGFPPDLRWWSGCRPHRPTSIALTRLSGESLGCWQQRDADRDTLPYAPPQALRARACAACLRRSCETCGSFWGSCCPRCGVGVCVCVSVGPTGATGCVPLPGDITCALSCAQARVILSTATEDGSAGGSCSVSTGPPATGSGVAVAHLDLSAIAQLDHVSPYTLVAQASPAPFPRRTPSFSPEPCVSASLPLPPSLCSACGSSAQPPADLGTARTC